MGKNEISPLLPPLKIVFVSSTCKKPFPYPCSSHAVIISKSDLWTEKTRRMG